MFKRMSGGKSIDGTARVNDSSNTTANTTANGAASTNDNNNSNSSNGVKRLSPPCPWTVGSTVSPSSATLSCSLPLHNGNVNVNVNTNANSTAGGTGPGTGTGGVNTNSLAERGGGGNVGVDVNVNTNNNSVVSNLEIGVKTRQTPSPMSTPSCSPSPPAFTTGATNPFPSSVSLLSTATTNQTQTSTTIANTSTANSCLSDHNEKLSEPSPEVECVLSAACEAMGFDIVEMWLRTGPKVHQLINSHLRHTALDETTRSQLVDVYYGQHASERKHKLSPALCKKAKESNDVIWVSAQTQHGAQALKLSLNGVKTAVAVPVCHQDSNTNITLIYFSVKRAVMQPPAMEFLVHMSLAAAVVAVNTFNQDNFAPTSTPANPKRDEYHAYRKRTGRMAGVNTNNSTIANNTAANATTHAYATVALKTGPTMTTKTFPPTKQHDSAAPLPALSFTPPPLDSSRATARSIATLPANFHHNENPNMLITDLTTSPNDNNNNNNDPNEQFSVISITGAKLDLKFNDLYNVEYLTDGGNNWIHTAIMNSETVVVKQLKPEVQDVALAMNEIESELGIHAQLNHNYICALLGAGFTTRGTRFIVLERLDGGTLTQVLGYDTRIRDRRRRFLKSRKTKWPYVKVLNCAQQMATALDYCHRTAMAGSMILHRDLKPDNIGFTLDGTVKIIDFGLATVVPNASPDSDELFEMSGETGSLRYMAPEAASARPYNHKVDVYSFGMILWELVAWHKPFDGMNREEFYERVVYGGERPDITKKFPKDLEKLIRECWDPDPDVRPNFSDIITMLSAMLLQEKGGGNANDRGKFSRSERRSRSKKSLTSRLASNLKERHSTWF